MEKHVNRVIDITTGKYGTRVTIGRYLNDGERPNPGKTHHYDCITETSSKRLSSVINGRTATFTTPIIRQSFFCMFFHIPRPVYSWWAV